MANTVKDVRDSLGLSYRLQSIGNIPESDLSEIAVNVADDVMMDNALEGVDPTEDELKTVLRDAW